ncbi:Phosphoglycolate phosphatase [Sporomusa aerivorans]
MVNRNKIKAVIFDLDGTLVDSEPNYFASDRKLLAEYDIDFDEIMRNKYVGVGSREMIGDIIKYHPISETIENLMIKKNKYYTDIAKANTVVFPEMIRLLDILKKNNYPTALASGSSPEVIELVLSVTNLRHYFDVVLSAEHVAKGKPAPDIFLEAAKRLGIPAENCLVLEDAQPGVEAAKRACMRCVAIPYLIAEPLHDSFSKADMLFRKGMAEFAAETVFEWLTKYGEFSQEIQIDNTWTHRVK